jgi:hypothetical protein
MAKKTAVGGMDFGGDPGKWLALAGLLISLGVLPRKWKGPVTAPGIGLWLWRNFG